MDVLRTVTEHVLVTYVCPNKSVVGLETIDIVKGEESATQNGETGRGPNAVDGFPLFIGSTRSRDALTSVIAYDCFVHSYLHQSLSYFAVTDVIIGIHSQDHVVPLIS